MEGEIAPSSSAVNAILEIFERGSSSEPPFPPAELYSEGWMLRLAMEGHHLGHSTLPIPTTGGSRWYSEARLASPFQPSRRGDPHGEGITHADGVIGQFEIRDDTIAGFTLSSENQFVVIEAKMGSKLSAGTSRVGWFDQAARNVAAMAWAIAGSEASPQDFESLAFLVAAPHARLEAEPTFVDYTDRVNLMSKIERRIELYQSDDPDRHQALTEFRRNIFEPFLEVLDVRLWSWEEAIESTSDVEYAASLQEFYEQCLAHNGLVDNA